MMAPTQPETSVAVQGFELGQQTTHSTNPNPTYNPAEQVNGLFSSSRSLVPASSVQPPTTTQTPTGTSNQKPANGATSQTATTPSSSSTGASATTSVVVQTNLASQSGGGSAKTGTATANQTTNSTTKNLVTTLKASQPPPAGATLSYTAGPNGSNLTLKLDSQNPSQLDLIDNATGAVVASSPLDQINQVVVTGANYANDTLTVNMSKPFWLSGGVSFSGGAGGYDTLAIVGPTGGHVGYTAIGSGSGTAVISLGSESTSINFTGLEPVDISGGVSYTFTPGSASPATSGTTINPSAAVDLTIGTGTYTDSTGALQPMNVLTGTIGGVAFEQVNLENVSSLTIDLSGGSTPVTNPDTVTVGSGGFVATGLNKVTIDTGIGTNVVTIAASNIGLPVTGVSGGGFTVNGGASGTTSLVLSGTYSTASTELTGPTSGTLILDGSSLSFSNISKPLDITATSYTFSLGTVNATNPVDLTIGTDSGGLVNQLTGTIGGTATVPAVAFLPVNLESGVSNLTIDLSGNTGGSSIPYTGNDTVTLGSAGFVTTTLQNVTIDTGEGTNTVTIAAPSISLPTSGGSFTVNGNTSGTTSLVVSESSSQTTTVILTPAPASSTSGTLSLDGSPVSFSNVSQSLSVTATTFTFSPGTANATNPVDLTIGTDSSGLVNQLTGTIGGTAAVAFLPVNLVAVADLLVNLSGTSTTPDTGNDTVTVGSDFVSTSPLSSVTIETGTGTNTVTLAGSSIALPVSGGSFTVNGNASGTTSLAVNGSYTAALIEPTGATSGTINLDGASLGFSNISEPLDVTTPNVTFSPGLANQANPVDLTIGADSSGQVNQLTATISATVPYAFLAVNLDSGVSNLTIDLSGTSDQSAPYTGNDTVTLGSAGFVTSTLQSATIHTGAGTNTVTLAGSSIALPVSGGSFTVDGNISGATSLVVNGSFTTASVSLATPTSGTLALDGWALTFSNISEPIDISATNYVFTPGLANAANPVDVTIGTDSSGLVNQLTGSVGGTGFAAVNLVGVTNLLIDLSGNVDESLVPYTGNDTVTLGSAGFVTTTLQNVTIDTGAGTNNVVTIAASNIALPASGGSFTVVGAVTTTANGTSTTTGTTSLVLSGSYTTVAVNPPTSTPAPGLTSGSLTLNGQSSPSLSFSNISSLQIASTSQITPDLTTYFNSSGFASLVSSQENAAQSATPSATTFTATVSFAFVSLGGVLELNNVQLTVNGTFNTTSSAWSVTASIAASSGTLFPGRSFSASLANLTTPTASPVTLTYDGTTNTYTPSAYSLNVGTMTLAVGQALVINASSFNLNYDPAGAGNQTLATVGIGTGSGTNGTATVDSPQFSGLGTQSLPDFVLRADGFSFGSPAFTANSPVSLLNGVITATATLTVTAFDVSYGYYDATTSTNVPASLSGSVSLSLSNVELYPAGGVVQYNGTISASGYDFNASTFNGTSPMGQLSITISNFSLSLGTALEVSASTVVLTPGQAVMATIPTATLSSPQFSGLGSLTINNLALNQDGFSIGSLTWASSGAVSIGKIIQANGVTLTLTNVALQYGTTPTITGQITASASGVVLFPTEPLLDLNVGSLSGSYYLADPNHPAAYLQLQITNLDIPIGDAFTINLGQVTLSLSPDISAMVSVNDATITVNLLSSLTSTPISFSLSTLLSNYNSSNNTNNPTSFTLLRTGFDLGSFTISPSNTVAIGNFFTLSSLSIDVTNFGVNIGSSPAISGTIDVSFQNLALFPNSSVFQASFTKLTGSYYGLNGTSPTTPPANALGQFVLSADSMILTIGNQITITTGVVTLTPGASTIATVASATLTFTALNVTGNITNLVVTTSDVSFSKFTLAASPPPTVSLGSILTVNAPTLTLTNVDYVYGGGLSGTVGISSTGSATSPAASLTLGSTLDASAGSFTGTYDLASGALSATVNTFSLVVPGFADFSAGSVSIAYTPAASGSPAEFLVGATGLNALVGTGTVGTTSATGVEILNGTLALAVFDAGGTITYSLDVQGTPSLVGMPTGTLSFSPGTLEFVSNTAGAVSTVVTVGGNPVNLDFTVNEQAAFAAGLSMSVGTFASLSGDFGFSDQTVGSQTYIAIGAVNVNATVAVGNVSLTVVGGTLSLLIAPGTSSAATTYALVAGGGTDSLNGVPNLTLTGTGLNVLVRNGLDPTAVTGLSSVSILDASSGSLQSVSLDFSSFSSLASITGNVTEVQGTVTLAVTNFVSMTGSFAFQKFTDSTSGSTYFTVAASGLTVVLGTAATNVTIGNANFGLLIEPGSGTGATTYALEATASSISLNGISGFGLSGSNLLVLVRQGLDPTTLSTSVQTTLPSGLLPSDFFTVQAGAANLIVIEGQLTLTITPASGSSFTGYGSLTGNFGFQTFTDGVTGNTDWAVGASAVTVVVGTGTTNFTVSNASLALLVRPGDTTNPATFALDATASSASLTGISGLSVSATNIVVRVRQGLDVSTASNLPSSVQTSTAGTSAPFDFSGLPSGSTNLFDIEASVTLTVGPTTDPFFTLGGNFGIQSYTDTSGTNYLEFGGTGITATLTAGTANVTVANATLGVIVEQGTTTTYALQATGTLSLKDTSLSGLTLSASNLLVRASNGLDVSKLPWTANSLPIIHTSGGDVTLNLSGFGSGATSVMDIEGHLTLGIAGFASLTGDFGFQRFSGSSGDYLAIGAQNVNAVLGTKTVNVSVTGASLALLIEPGVGYDLIANGGTDTLNGVTNLSISASGLTVQSNQGLDLTKIANAPGQVDTAGGSVPFAFTGLGAVGTTSISGTITLTVKNFVSLTGTFGFTESTSGTLTKILVGATNVSTFIGSSDQTFGVQITGASLALAIYRDTTTSGSSYALEASAPSISIKGLPNGITLSGSVTVAINTTGGAVNETIPSTGQTLTFTDGTNGTVNQSNIRSIGGSVTLIISSIVSLQGDFSFTSLVTGTGTSAVTELLVGATNVGTVPNSSVTADGGAGSFTLSNGTLGMVIFSGGTYALKASATATATVAGGGLSANATLTIRINTTTSAQNETVTVGTTSLPVVFSSTEVATVSGGTTTIFKQILVQNASLSLDNTLIITAGQATSTTPVAGATSIPLTTVTLTLQNPNGSEVLFTISADSAVYTSFSGTVTASAASAAGLPVRSDGNSWVAGDKALVLTNVSFSIGSVVTFTANQIDVQHFTSGTGTTDSFAFSVATVTFYAGGKPMVSLTGSPSFQYSTTGGFQLNSFSNPGVSFLGQPDPPATVPLGPITLVGPSVSFSNFGFAFVSGTTNAALSATITISASTATIGATTNAVHATLTNVSGSFGVTATFNLANLTAAPSISANGFTMQASSFSIAIGAYLTISATGTASNPLYFNPTAAPTQVLISFASLTATLNAGPVSISGTALDFAIDGNGSFVAGSNFGVSLSLGQNADGSSNTSSLDWPSWLPLQGATVSLFWKDFNTSPTNFVIELSATVSINQFKGLPLSLTGSVTNLVIDPSLLAQGDFPITSVGSVLISVSGQLFGGKVSGTLIFGVVRFDASGAVVDGLNYLIDPATGQSTTTQGTGPYTTAFYAGIEASFSLGGMSGFQIMIGLSDFGPLEVYVATGNTVTIPLGDTGLFLSDFSGDIKFGTAFPTLNISNPPQASDALQLNAPQFSSPASLTPLQWQAQLAAQVAQQYHSGATPGSGWVNLSKGPFIIGAGVTLSVANPNVFRVHGEIYFDTTGNILVIGTATVANNLSYDVKMYANLSSLFDASSSNQSGVALNILYLMDVPQPGSTSGTSPPIYRIYGVMTLSDKNAVFQMSIAGAADLNVLNGLQAHIQATVTLTFTQDSFNVTLADASFSIPQLQSAPLGTAAGSLTFQTTASGTINIWGGLLLTPNLQGLGSAGITIAPGSEVVIQLNTTNSAKTITLSTSPTTSTKLTLPKELFNLYVSGAANFKVSGAQAFQINGVLNFRIADGSLTLFVNAQLLMGPDPANPILTFNATGVIFVQVVPTNTIPIGIAAEMMLTETGSVPGVTFNENWLLVMNTTGVQITYDIPASVLSALGSPPTVSGPDYSSSSNLMATTNYLTTVNGANGQTVYALVIPSGPPGTGLKSYANWTPTLPNTPYLIILGRGSLTVAGSFTLSGNINIDAFFGPSGLVFNLDANATLDLQANGNTVFSFLAVGGIQISQAGVVAAIALSTSPGFSIPSSLGFALSAGFTLELNTTGVATGINGILVPAGSNGLFAEVHAVGDLMFYSGTADFNGTFDLTATASSLTIAIDANITFLNATFHAKGFAGVYYDSNPGVALSIQLGLPGGGGIQPVPNVDFIISGTFTLAINTSGTSRNSIARDSGTVSVSNLSVYLYGFNLTGSLSINISNSGFSINVPYLYLNFFGAARLKLSGYYSDGSFSFSGSAGFNFSAANVGSISGTLTVTISNTKGFSASWSGSVSALGVTVAGASGGVSISSSGSVDIYFYINVQITPPFTVCVPFTSICHHFSGTSVSGTVKFHFGSTSPPPAVAPAPSPPQLAGVGNGVLTLFLGSDVGKRGVGAQVAEVYSLTLGSTPNTIIVSALGYTQTYTGVDSILVNNTLTGNDTIAISNTIDLPVNITLGSGTNVISTGSGAATVDITGNGANMVTTGSGADITIEGTGANHVSTGSGSTVIIEGNGPNLVSTGSGSTVDIEGSGANTVATGGGSTPFTISGNGNNTVYVSNGGTFTFTVSGTGANHVTIAGGSPTVDLTSTASGANTISIDSPSSGSGTIDVIGGGDNVINSIGAGTTSLTISGNGGNDVSIGAGASTVTITGNGANTIATGAGTATIALKGSGATSVTTGTGQATIYDEGTGSTSVQGGSGGGVYVGGVDAAGQPFATKGASSVATVYKNFSVQMSGYSTYVLSDTNLSYGTFSLALSGVNDVTLTAAVGQNAHSFTLTGWTGGGTLNGAGSDNTLVSAPAAGVGNLAYVLSDAQLQVSGDVIQTIALSDIQTANLTGGSGTNSFDVSGWTGDGHLVGPAGSSSSLIASGDSAVFSLSDTSLGRTNDGTMTLTGIQTASLTGGPDANVFNVNDWSGTAQLDGAAGSDTYNLTLSGTTTGTIIVADTGAGPGDVLNVTGSKDFIVTANEVQVGTEQVTYSGIETLNLVGAVDGLSYYVQSTGTGVATSVETGGSASYIDVGSTAGQVPSAAGVVSTIQGPLSVSGGGSMVIDDTGSSSAQTGKLTSTSLTGFGMVPVGIQYQGLSLLTIDLGSAGNTLKIDGTMTGSTFVTSGAGNDSFTVKSTSGPLSLATGDGNDTVTVESTGAPLIVTAGNGNDAVNIQSIEAAATVTLGSGSDTVTVGSLAPSIGGVVGGIDGLLTVNGGSGSDTLTVDDSGDMSTASLSLGASHIGGLLMPEGITYSSIADLVLLLGPNVANVTINGTAVGTTTSLTLGPGDNTVNIQATGGPLAVNTGGGNDTINISADAPQNTGTLANILGAVSIDAGTGSNMLNVSDSGDSAPHGNVVITGSSITGLSPASISYVATNGTFGGGVNIWGGSGGNTITIASTNHSAGTTTTVWTGEGSDTVTVTEANPPSLVINGQGGNDYIDATATTTGVTITDGNGNDIILGGSGNDTITAGNGNDEIIGGAGADTITAGNGNDILIGDNGQVVRVNGQVVLVESTNPTVGGNDVITAGSGNDVIIGGAGSDTISAAGNALTHDIVIGDNGYATFGGTAPFANGQSTSTVSFNFAGYGLVGSSVTGTAGATGVAASNWNNLQGDSGSYGVSPSQTVLFGTGSQAGGVTISWGTMVNGTPSGEAVVSQESYGWWQASQSGADSQNAQLLDSYLSAPAGQSVGAEVSGLSYYYSSYDVYVYLGGTSAQRWGGTTSGAQTTAVSDGSTSYYLTTSTGQTVEGTLVQVTSTNPNAPGMGDYVVFSGLTSNSFTVTAVTSAASGGRDAWRHTVPVGIAGIEIVGQKLPIDRIATTSPLVGGNNVITLAGGSSIVFGGPGADTITIGGSGNNFIVGDNGEATLVNGLVRNLTSTNSTIGGNDTIITGAGNDVLIGGAGSDTLNGGAGNNLLFGDNASVSFFPNGQLGVTLLDPAVGGNDTLIAGPGTNLLYGQAGNDTYVFPAGAYGNDTIVEAGNNNPYGFPNDPNDTLDFSSFGASIRINLATTRTQLVSGSYCGTGPKLYITLSSSTGVEDVIGSAGGDLIIGNSRNNTLIGGPGNDRIFGGAGNDLLAGGGGQDFLDGGSGVNLVFFPGAKTGVYVNLSSHDVERLGDAHGAGYATDGLGGTDTLVNISGAIGTPYADTLIGNNQANFFAGMGGADLIITGAGNDTVVWSEGDGNATIDLGPGHNTLILNTGATDGNISVARSTSETQRGHDGSGGRDCWSGYDAHWDGNGLTISGGSGTSAWTLTVKGVGVLVINAADANAVVTTSGFGDHNGARDHEGRPDLIVNLGAAPFTAADYLAFAPDHGFSDYPAEFTSFSHVGADGGATGTHDHDVDAPLPATYTIVGFGTSDMRIVGPGCGHLDGNHVPHAGSDVRPDDNGPGSPPQCTGNTDDHGGPAGGGALSYENDSSPAGVEGEPAPVDHSIMHENAAQSGSEGRVSDSTAASSYDDVGLPRAHLV